jgi:uncharacterized repeat protein (TIGR03803 family)
VQAIFSTRRCAGLTLGLVSLAFSATAVAAAKDKIRYTFPVWPTQTGTYGGPLAADPSGNLYGTSDSAGAHTCPDAPCGAVVEYTPPTGGSGAWQSRVLYSFTGGADGAYPTGRVLIDPSGALIGVAISGGVETEQEPYGLGTVWRLSPPVNGTRSFSVLYAFQLTDPIDTPFDGVAEDASGNLYGVAEALTQAAGTGAVYTLKPDNGAYAMSILHAFVNYSDGTAPTNLTLSGTTLYGITLAGGGNVQCENNSDPGCGTVFSLSTSGTFKVIYTFTGANDGGDPVGDPVVDASQNVYVQTAWGGANTYFGTIDQVTPPVHGNNWGLNVLYTYDGFEGGTVGLSPGMTLGGNGVLYGTTYMGDGDNGENPRNGDIWCLTPPARHGSAWSWKPLYLFEGSCGGDCGARSPSHSAMDGDLPAVPPTFGLGGALYGTTNFGGKNGNGIVWSLKVK